MMNTRAQLAVEDYRKFKKSYRKEFFIDNATDLMKMTVPIMESTRIILESRLMKIYHPKRSILATMNQIYKIYDMCLA